MGKKFFLGGCWARLTYIVITECFASTKQKKKTEREKGGQRGTPTSGVLTHSRWVIKFER